VIKVRAVMESIHFFAETETFSMTHVSRHETSQDVIKIRFEATTLLNV